ncbi:MAG: hypothetical protein FJY37_11020 [Betaproteobacteria bacterium]|nr:hypothetical protein [Betaproteobacteria bacterium]
MNRKLPWQLSMYGLIALAIILFFNVAGSERDWSLHADQEFTLAYNALLVNSGLAQEYEDHPGFFTIRALALAIKFYSAIGLSPIRNLTDLNATESAFEGYTHIVRTARHMAVLSIIILIGLAYWAATATARNHMAALLVAATVFFSDGMIVHFVQLRTEPIALLWFLASLLCIAHCAGRDETSRAGYFFTGMLFYFFSLLNKIQILAYYPLCVAWVLYLRSRIQFTPSPPARHDAKDIVLAWASVLLCVVFFILMASWKSKMFVFAFLVGMNCLAFVYWRTRTGNLPRLLTGANIFFLLAYALSRLMVTVFDGRSDKMFARIHSPLDLLDFAGGDIRALAIDSPGGQILRVATEHLLSPITQTLLQVNSQSIYFFFVVALFYVCRNRLDRHERKFVLLGLAVFYITVSISSLRYLAPHYIIFSETILVGLYIFLLGKIEQKVMTALTVTLVIVSCNYGHFISELNSPSNYRFDLCTGTYMKDFHSRLDLDKFKNACMSAGYIKKDPPLVD